MTAEKAQKRLLVFGAGGQVGTELVRRGTASGFCVSGLDRNAVDITDAAAVEEAVRHHRPDITVNAAAYTAVDRAESEPELAHAVNGKAPGLIGTACARAGIPLLHISTDYVFDGMAHGAYRETDPVAPLGVYGRSKAEGEENLRQAAPMHIILRTAWVFSPFGRNFVKTMLKLASERDHLSVVDDQRGSPTAAGDIAEALLAIAIEACRASPDDDAFPWGTYHFCNDGVATWRQFAQAIMDRALLQGAQVVPVEGIATADYPTAARRPANSVLDCSLIGSTFGIVPRRWEEALDDVLDELLPYEGQIEGTNRR